ncbi:MAG TPA: 4Fe-4S double cluster binding domain-containing protein [Methanobacterium sp.]|nr:4Fe-4S double cluster binding domain-containing protein [Methanobacterium sp.]
MQLDYRIRIMAEHEGADFFGIADLSRAKEAIADQGGVLCAQYSKAISIGITLPQTVVDELPNRENRAVAVNYRHAYDITNLRLDLLTSKLGSIIQQEGYKALPVPASERFDDERICAVFSHKLAANLAGLGWIGKSCLLVTPEAGPRVRWATVLTDAPLIITGKPMEVQCGECNECVEICPVSAFTGEPFREEERREVRYNAKKCEDYVNKACEDADWTVCGLCIYACPHGKK